MADITGMLDLSSWPAGMRVVVGKERPHPGAQLRFTDVGGHLSTCFATDARRGQLADLEFRHRRRTRCSACPGPTATGAPYQPFRCAQPVPE